MALTGGGRLRMSFVAVAIVFACLFAIAALVLAAIMVSMLRSANVSTAPKTDGQSAVVQGKQTQWTHELVIMSSYGMKMNAESLLTISSEVLGVSLTNL